MPVDTDTNIVHITEKSDPRYTDEIVKFAPADPWSLPMDELRLLLDLSATQTIYVLGYNAEGALLVENEAGERI